jgi:hypothetical protein
VGSGFQVESGAQSLGNGHPGGGLKTFMQFPALMQFSLDCRTSGVKAQNRGETLAPPTLRSTLWGTRGNFDALTGEGPCDPSYTWTASVFVLLAEEAESRWADKSLNRMVTPKVLQTPAT